MSVKIPSHIYQKIWTFPEYAMGAHLVTLVLKDGTKRKNVIVAGGEVYGSDVSDVGYLSEDIVDALRQFGTQTEGEKAWWDPSNEKWWES